MNDVTRILSAIERGDAQATDELLPLVYGKLRFPGTRNWHYFLLGSAGCFSCSAFFLASAKPVSRARR